MIKPSKIILSILASTVAVATILFLQCEDDRCLALRRPLENLIKYQSIYAPCDRPILYTLGTFDAKFGLSKPSFLNVIKEAEMIWEKPIGKELFTYDEENGNLKINLIYDYRQEVSGKLKSLGIVVRETRASYDELKAKYTVLNQEYIKLKADYTMRVAAWNDKQNAYEQEVKYWNGKGGAPKAEYERLQKDELALQAEFKTIKEMEVRLNEYVENINSLVAALNNLAAALNLDVGKYNEIGATRGEEFTEGDYVQVGRETNINIYEFSSRAKLVRVLAHEFGHALGLPHVDDPRAIMYRLNSSANEKLTKDDLSALKVRCAIK